MLHVHVTFGIERQNLITQEVVGGSLGAVHVQIT